jgi:uncharacterized protein YdaL
MYKRVIYIILIILILITNVNIIQAQVIDNNARAKINENKNLLLLFDRQNYIGDRRNAVIIMEELLGHFRINTMLLDQKDYYEGMIKEFDYTIVIGLEDFFDNEALIRDCSKYNNTLLWIGRGIERILELKESNIVYNKPVYDLLHISYIDHYNKGNMKSYDIGVKRRFEHMTAGEGVKVTSYMDDGLHKYPFILSENNFHYISRMDLSEPVFYIISDFLFDILPAKKKLSQKIFIRIEDVHPFRDTKRLKYIADLLYDNNIPFMVGIIPAYREKGSKKITTLSEVPEFVKTIQYMQGKGGTILLHGYTHSIYGQDVTGEGYEYWDVENDIPLDVHMGEWIDYTVGNGLRECVDNGIYPLGFEAPHYAMSQEAYIRLKKYFSTYVGQVQSSDWGFSTTTFPYDLYDTKLFHTMIPENLGYIDVDAVNPIKQIENRYKNLQILRSYTAGVFIHSFVDIEYFKQLIELIREWNIPVYDMKKDNHWVKYGYYEIYSNNGEIEVEEYFIKKTPVKKLNNFIITFSYVIISVLIFIIGLFFIIYRNSRNKTKNL